jgi:hypothetical protein
MAALVATGLSVAACSSPGAPAAQGGPATPASTSRPPAVATSSLLPRGVTDPCAIGAAFDHRLSSRIQRLGLSLQEDAAAGDPGAVQQAAITFLTAVLGDTRGGLHRLRAASPYPPRQREAATAVAGALRTIHGDVRRARTEADGLQPGQPDLVGRLDRIGTELQQQVATVGATLAADRGVTSACPALRP